MLNIEELIQDKSDMSKNRGLSSVNGYSMQQNYNALQIFYDFLAEYKPSRILEVGTGLGGFSMFMNMCVKDLNIHTDILSYDIVERNWFQEYRQYVNIQVKNIFDHSYSNLVDSEVSDYIRQDGLTLLLCDGGCKRCEFNILASHIKSNDIIMTHDYAPNSEYFNSNMRGIIWNWHEIQDAEISNAMIENNIVRHSWYDRFLGVAWGCFVKS